MAIRTMEKTPTEDKRFGVNWSTRLQSQAATIATSTWQAAAGVTLSAITDHDSYRASCIVSGGTTGQTYRITNIVTTTDGQRLERSIDIAIVAAA